jgi:hypothetical protein
VNGAVRELVLDNGTSELTEGVASGGVISKLVYNYTGGAATLYIYSNLGGINIYGVKVEKTDSPTPILHPNLSPTTSHLPTYYTLKGEPLGSAKPVKAGVYIVKQGSSIHKIAVRR